MGTAENMDPPNMDVPTLVPDVQGFAPPRHDSLGSRRPASQHGARRRGILDQGRTGILTPSIKVTEREKDCMGARCD